MTKPPEDDPLQASQPDFVAEPSAYLVEQGVGPAAVAYFEAELADDPVTQRMNARLAMVVDELDHAGLGCVIEAAMFERGLDKLGASEAVGLAFELAETTCQILDGSQSKPAMQQHCDTQTTRQAAVVLNSLARVARHKQSYGWTREALRSGPLKTYAQIALSVVEADLAQVALELNHELRFLPRIDTYEDQQSGQAMTVIAVASLVVVWMEGGQIHCGLSDRYGARWADVARYGRRRGFQIHTGFQGPVLDDDRLDEICATIAQKRQLL